MGNRLEEYKQYMLDHNFVMDEERDLIRAATNVDQLMALLKKSANGAEEEAIKTLLWIFENEEILTGDRSKGGN